MPPSNARSRHRPRGDASIATEAVPTALPRRFAPFELSRLLLLLLVGGASANAKSAADTDEWKACAANVAACTEL